MMENTFGNHQKLVWISGVFYLFLDDFQNYFTSCQAIFLFKMFGLAYKKTSEMKELAPNKKPWKSQPTTPKNKKVRANQKSAAGSENKSRLSPKSAHIRHDMS